MGCFLSKEELMVASIRNSDTKKAQVALRMGVRLNGALNVRRRLPPGPGPAAVTAAAPRCVALRAASLWVPRCIALDDSALCTALCLPPLRRRRTRRSSSPSEKTSWTW